jgi:hypothetical protein
MTRAPVTGYGWGGGVWVLHQFAGVAVQHPFCHDFRVYRPEAQEGKGGTVPHAPLMIFVGCRSGHCCNKGEITLNL